MGTLAQWRLVGLSLPNELQQFWDWFLFAGSVNRIKELLPDRVSQRNHIRAIYCCLPDERIRLNPLSDLQLLVRSLISRWSSGVVPSVAPSQESSDVSYKMYIVLVVREASSIAKSINYLLEGN